jgi:glycerophosphoryl diester phosphodiesterase
MRRWLVRIAAVFLLIAAGLWLNNSSWLYGPDGAPTSLLAHRGVHQTYPSEGLENDTCTATRINAPTHGYLENTLASMEAAFAAGASIVEFDVHPTTDGQFAVFHDWTLDCRANGKGRTRDSSMAALKTLDIGYGYTADGGATFPFRGSVGLMPTLDEVLARFPDKRFLINIKSDDPEEGEKLAERLAVLMPEARSRLSAYGGDRPIGTLGRALPDLKVMSKGSLKRCLIRYLALGWAGHVPAACRNSVILVPVNLAHWVWGFPHRFVARMKAAGSDVYITGPFNGREFSTGIDSESLLRRVPADFGGGIWTNHIEAIGPLAKTR